MINRPIVVLDDDADDREILEEIFVKLNTPYPRVFFDDPDKLLAYLTTAVEHPLVILSDVNLIKTNGIDLKKQINQNELSRKKTIPFVFLSTTTDPRSVDIAYDLGV